MEYRLDKNYDSLDRLDRWDETTRAVIKDRLKKETGGRPNFFYLTARQGAALKKLVDALIPQEEGGEYINIAQMIDRSLSDKKEGVRFGEDPWRGEFYRAGLAKISDAPDGMPGGGAEAENFIRQVLRDAATIYCSHPAAWNKMGFPGPAYPEGYYYLGCGEKEKWEPEYFKE